VTIAISSGALGEPGHSLRILISLHNSVLDFDGSVDVSVRELVLVVATDSIMLALSEFDGSPFEISSDELDPSTQLRVESPSVVPTSRTEEMIDDPISDRASASAEACFGGWLSGDTGLEFRASLDALDFSCSSFVRPSTSIPSIMCSPIVGSNAIIVNDTFCWLFQNHLLKLPARSIH